MDIQLAPKPWYIRYRLPLIGVALFLLLVIGLIFAVSGPKRLRVNADDVGIEEATLTSFVEYVNAEGTLQPIETIRIGTRESGIVSRIVAEEGASLAVGDTILILTNPELEREIADQRAEWQRQLNNHQSQLIEMEQQRLTREQQQLDNEYEMKRLEKQWQLDQEEYRMGIKSKAQLEVAEEEYRYKHHSAQLQQERGEQEARMAALKRDMLEGDLEVARGKLQRSEARREGLVVTAPVSGQLSALDAVLGQSLSASSTIGEIKIMDRYKVHAALGEYYIDKLQAGQVATITADGMTYPLRISHIVPEVKDRTFAFDLVFTDNLPAGARIGKGYQVRIELSSSDQAVTIPKGNFYPFTAGQWLFRVNPDGNSASRVPVTIGRQNPLCYEVTEGLQPGDRVLTSGYERCGDAAKIMLK